MEVKKNNRYENGKIYTIRSHQTDKYYIGSTCLELYKRLWKHRDCYKRFQKGGVKYISSFEIIKFDDHYIELLENFKCETKNELERKEGEFIRKYKDEVVNMVVAGRTIEEWRADNKDKIKIQMKVYRDNNKDKIHKVWKQNYEKNKEIILEKMKEKFICDCGSEFRKKDKSRHNKSIKHMNFIKHL